MKEELLNLQTSITEMKTDIKWIRKEIEGNGTKGLLQQVAENKSAIDKGRGAVIFLGIITTVLAIITFIT